jgi:hypothetical protein
VCQKWDAYSESIWIMFNDLFFTQTHPTCLVWTIHIIECRFTDLIHQWK